MKHYIRAIELLLQYGANLDIKEADGLPPSNCLSFGPQVTAVVHKWIRKRSGQEAPRDEKGCDCCGVSDKPLKNCAKCHVARYCSVECQRKEWSTHKKTCQPFSAGNTVTFKPYYVEGENTMPTEVLRNKFFGLNHTTPQTHYRAAHVSKNLSEGKNMVVKVQLPYNLVMNRPEPGAGPLFVYNKKRDFVCRIRREDGAAAYDRISSVIATKGVGGAKAYFAAELKRRDELVIKATCIISGSLRVQPNQGVDHLATLRFLVSRGLAVDIPDIIGWTALHHVVIGQSLRVDLLRELLKSGAKVDHQNRYGDVPLLGAYQKNYTAANDLLLEYGADLEAEGLTPRRSFLMFGPQVTAVVQKWIRKRSGEEAPRNEKRCDSCGTTEKPLKNCAKCHVDRYCSVECQKKEWGTHKKTCQPFSEDNIVTIRPYYAQDESMMPIETHRNRFFGVEHTTPQTHYRAAHIPKNLATGKNMVIKVQLPYDLKTKTVIPCTGALLVYNKKHDFVSCIRREDGAAAYDRIRHVVATKGARGAKAYFAAELKTKDELTIEISEVLAEQPF
ncbi:Ankyrin-2 [Termitomyces sp. T112]|nr:Ankyrin-2 [Termitomyces sp. T112]